MDDQTTVVVDDLMAEVAARVRQRIVDPRLRASPGFGSTAPEDIDAAAALMQRALDQRDRLLLSPLLLDDEDEWRLRTSLQFQSHRPRIGRAIVAIKRGLLLPALRWLHEFSRDNFVRQQQINASLLACVEVLMIEVVRLRREAGAGGGALPGRGTP